ncbi:basic helix-loop-helix protein [Lithohypha guttulata]|uniref:Basic helix-loop-helix protein n=1 Tax=Lithohypha guttulata TaxID=1690604 RepID=A0AAN7YEN5_9EURO|nr:basic helix-loop-helix protein [Lithohypha guttulata]KAK5096666.1 basic helix-loop-helix protein [Lithohypha guttulata]
MATNNPPSPNSNKRKRDHSESGPGRGMKAPATNGDNSANAMFISLLQGIDENTGPVAAQDETSRTAQAALQQQQSSYPEPNVFDHSGQTAFDESHLQPALPHHQLQASGQSIFDARQPQPGKPAVGTQAWHQQRKDSHKEVERRRREVINEGIENIAKMIPGQDKNKGHILASACRYIQELQAKIASFDNERNVFEITQQELTRRNESLRDSAQRAWQETAKWMGRCREAGLQFDDYDGSVEAAEALEENTNLAGVASNGEGYAVDKAENTVS